jgi:hypothetical protein
MVCKAILQILLGLGKAVGCPMVFVTWQMTLYGNPFPKSLLGVAHSIIGLVKSGF